MELRIPILWIEETASGHIELELVADRTNEEEIILGPDAGKWLLSTDNGLTTKTIVRSLCEAWGAGEMSKASNQDHAYTISKPGLRVLLGTSFWCPANFVRYGYRIHRHGWLGTLTFSKCKGIFNIGSGVIRAKGVITDKDIPLTRDDNWRPVGDSDAYEAANPNPNLLCIEKSSISPENFEFTVQGMQQISAS